MNLNDVQVLALLACETCSETLETMDIEDYMAKSQLVDGGADEVMVFDMTGDGSWGPMSRASAETMQERAVGTLREGAYAIVEREHWGTWSKEA
jgi:hypothetical protein